MRKKVVVYLSLSSFLLCQYDVVDLIVWIC